MKKPKEIILQTDRLYRHLARVPGVSYPFLSLLLLNSIENWIAIQKFPARTAQRRYRGAAEGFDSVVFGSIVLPRDGGPPCFVIFGSRHVMHHRLLADRCNTSICRLSRFPSRFEDVAFPALCIFYRLACVHCTMQTIPPCLEVSGLTSVGFLLCG
ncbi:hypothetical protein EDD85DRAFT_145154 [Armillaria nabsnona]|nr:hypothetical protein EDD85DRAFT_145154 [Armillaria nabsnona]